MKLWGAGMPMRLVNEYLDLGLPEFDGWEVGYLPMGVVPVEESGAPEEMPELDENRAEAEPGPVGMMLRELRRRQQER
ncbi:MAG: hypothetical protein N2322_04460, partial [Terrimicrobiaceae bacterium]|nr:hypothetical protein [Terrimicrobiaceae bacterium]